MDLLMLPFSLRPGSYHLGLVSVSTLSLEGSVLCESNSCGSLTLGFTGGFYSFSSWDFVVAVVFKNVFLYLKFMVLVLYFSKIMN